MKTMPAAFLSFCFFLNVCSADDPFSDIESHIRNHADSMAKACVSIKARNGAWGSGVIVNRSLIFSAAHVYRRAGEQVTVFLGSETRVSATVIKFDLKHDVAVLKMGGELRGVVPAKVDRGFRMEDGKTLIAAGHASGFNAERRSPLRVGFGFLGQRKGMIYSTCRITAGDSGGPLYDEAGILRGIHHTMDGSGKFSAHIPVQRFFQLWPELVNSVALV